MSRWRRERAWRAGRAGSRPFSSSSTGTGLESFEAEDLAALTEALIGRATLTDGGFLYASFRQVEAPDTWTADAAYPADSPIPYTLTAKAETLLGEASSPTTPLRKVHACGTRTTSSASPIGLSGQPGTYATKISVPPSDSGILRLHARMKEPEPEPEAGL